MRLKRLFSGILLAAVMITCMLPAAGARQFQSRTLLSVGDEELAQMIAGISAQTFTHTDTAAVVDYMEYFLFESAYAAIGGRAYPYTNYQGYWAGKTVTDGVYTQVVSGTGCFSYCKFVAQTMYGTQTHDNRNMLPERAGRVTAEGLKAFLKTYAQAGEHLRIDGKHSVTYISGTDEGFYYIDYAGDQNPYIRLRYATYANFAARCNELWRKVWLYDSDPAVNVDKPVAVQVSSKDWYYDCAVLVEDLGLMCAADAAAYARAFTVAEAVTLCARLNAQFTLGGADFAAMAGQNWYQPYVTYLEGIGVPCPYSDWNQPITRDQFVSMIYASLPTQLRVRADNCLQFVDSARIDGMVAAQSLCRMGVITGVQGEDGLYYHPDEHITRAQAAVIAARLMDPALRVY